MRRMVINEEKYMMIDRVEERMTPLDIEFSRLLHLAHAGGLSKMDLRKSTGLGNGPRFSELWALVADPERALTEHPVAAKESYEWYDDHTLNVLFGNTLVIASQVSWFTEELEDGVRKTPAFTLDPADQEHYAVVYRAVEAALNARDEEQS
jgi:hypothetical protein